MANYVLNKIHIEGPAEDIKNMMTKYADGMQHISGWNFYFDRIIPMPDNVYTGDLGPKEREEYPGDQNWYDWRRKHWGTKWEAIRPLWWELSDSDIYIQFETAWSAPFPIFKKMREDFEDLVFTFEYADEDLGRNCGIIFDGISFAPTSSEEAWKYACSLWGYDYWDYWYDKEINPKPTASDTPTE